jgi:hypothetical protein
MWYLKLSLNGDRAFIGSAIALRLAKRPGKGKNKATGGRSVRTRQATLTQAILELV